MSLYGHDIVTLVLFTSHEQTKLLHALGTTAWLGFAFRDLAAPCAVAVFLEEFFFAALTLAFKALDDVNGSSDVAIRIMLVLRRLGVLHRRCE